MSSQKNHCLLCKASFYGKKHLTCETCEKFFCPSCSSCECAENSYQSATYRKIRSITADNINTIQENDLLELNGTLSPLIRQEPIQTKNGKILKTEFEFSDESGKIPLTIWGPVPETIFQYRYEYINDITFQGAKKRIYKGKPVITILKSTKISVNVFRTKNLDYFLSEA